MGQLFYMPVILSSLKWKNFSEKSLNWIQSSSDITEKECNDCLRSVNLLSISFQIVFMDLVILNKILTSRLPFRHSNFGTQKMDIPNHDVTRKNFDAQTSVIASVVRFFFLQSYKLQQSMSLMHDFPNFNLCSRPPKTSNERIEL